MGKREIEQLLSAYIDGELPKRRQMEVRRLIENNAEAAALLQFLQKQKELLNAMPTASAPAGLAQRVLSTAEQKTTSPQISVTAEPDEATRLQITPLVAEDTQPQTPIAPAASEAAQPPAPVEPLESETIEPQMPAERLISETIQPQVPAEPVVSEAIEPQVPAEPVVSEAIEPQTPAEPVVAKTIRFQMPQEPVSTAALREQGQRQLLLRRVLTAAAMLFIPVGVLFLVVWTIVGPLSDKPASMAKAPEAPSVVNETTPAVVSFPLSASLYLTTSQPSQMDSFIHKAIYNHDLTNHASTVGLGISERTYQIRAGRERIVALLGDLATVWDKCDTTSMTVHGRTMAVNARIENVRPDQAIGLYQGNVFRDPVQYARQIDQMNQLMQATEDYATIAPVMPQLTSGRKTAAQAEPDTPEACVTLFINVRSR